MSLFKKFFASKKEEANPLSNQDQKGGLNLPMEKVKQYSDGYVNLGRSIFPVIKSNDDEGVKLTENINPLIRKHFADELMVCYVIDMGDRLERISLNHLNQFNLDKEEIHNAAMRNLTMKINENCRIKIHDYSSTNPEIKPFFEIEFDRNYNPSIMLLDEFWDTTAKEVTKSDLVAVSIPATNIIFMSDFKLMESFRTMVPVANSIYDNSISEGLQLTKETYIRKDNRWIRFLDTEEQFMDLMDF